MSDIIEEIKSRLSIEELVSQYVKLKKAGKNLKGLCPFHNEKTPSFIVSPEKQIAWCFGCQKGGDIFRFIQELENIDFKETIHLLAEKTNIDISKYNNDAAPRVSKDEKQTLIQAHEYAADFFIDQLHNSKKGQAALKYIKSRGISDQMIKQFQIGYAPEGKQETYKFLLSKNISSENIVAGGLATIKDTTGNQIYDRFRGRLIFPIKDHLNRIVAFAGRALKDDQQPKYLNSPESSIYLKRKLLYGYPEAKPHIKRLNFTIVVEGYLDVIASHQAGIHNIVATSGTAMTAQQLTLIKRLHKNIIFSFDTDQAGIDATKRAIEVGEQLQMNIRVASVSSGKDPADLIQHNPNHWAPVIKNAQDYIQFFLQIYQKQFASSYDPTTKTLEALIPLLKQIKSRIKLDKNIRLIANYLQISPQIIYDDIHNYNLPSSHPALKKNALKNQFIPTEFDHLIGLILTFPETIKPYFENLQQLTPPENLQSIYFNIWKHYNPTGLGLDKGNFFEDSTDIELNKINLITLYIEEKYKELSSDMIEKEVKLMLTKIIEKQNLNQRQQLMIALKNAEANNDLNKTAEILAQIQATYNN